VGANYFKPVGELLTTDPDRRKHVGKLLFVAIECRTLTHIFTVDLGCGNGIWCVMGSCRVTLWIA
jgi:hypothetical protein